MVENVCGGTEEWIVQIYIYIIKLNRRAGTDEPLQETERR